MARMYPLSEIGCDSDSLNVSFDIVGEVTRHSEPGSTDTCEVARNLRYGKFESSDSSSDVGYLYRL